MPTSYCYVYSTPACTLSGLCRRASTCQAKRTHLPPPVQVPGTSLAPLWRWTPMETGFLSLIPCDLLFIKVKLCVRKHNWFPPWRGYCSTSPLSCISARLCLPRAARRARSRSLLTATFASRGSAQGASLTVVRLDALKKRCDRNSFALMNYLLIYLQHGPSAAD